MKMIKLFSILIFCFAFLTGCITEKKRRAICFTCPVVSKSKDSIVNKTVTVTVQTPATPGPTVYLENPCKLLCDSLGNLKRNVNINVNKNGQILNLNTSTGALNITAATQAGTIAAQVQQKEIYSRKETDHIKYVPCENERTAFDGFTRYWFYITAGILLIWALWLFGRRFVPFLSK